MAMPIHISALQLTATPRIPFDHVDELKSSSNSITYELWLSWATKNGIWARIQFEFLIGKHMCLINMVRQLSPFLSPDSVCSLFSVDTCVCFLFFFFFFLFRFRSICVMPHAFRYRKVCAQFETFLINRRNVCILAPFGTNNLMMKYGGVQKVAPIRTRNRKKCDAAADSNSDATAKETAALRIWVMLCIRYGMTYGYG